MLIQIHIFLILASPVLNILNIQFLFFSPTYVDWLTFWNIFLYVFSIKKVKLMKINIPQIAMIGCYMGHCFTTLPRMTIVYKQLHTQTRAHTRSHTLTECTTQLINLQITCFEAT